jgi:dihydroorotate dehydrogenase
MLGLFHRILLLLPPEAAHHLGARGLKVLQWIRYRLGGERRCVGMAILPAAPKLAFSSRVGLAAGFDKNAELFAGLATLGFGFLEVGTVTPVAQAGNPKPRLFRKGNGVLLNHMGFNNCGLPQFRKNLERYRASLPGFPILGNVGKNKATPEAEALSDYRKGMQALTGVVDGFVVNLSSPNTPGLVKLQSLAFLESLEAIVPAGVPVLVKFSPDLENAALEDLLRFIGASHRLSGAVLTNTSRTLAEKLLQAPAGGLSGPPLKTRSLECVALARRYLPPGKILIGVGGIASVEDALEFRAAGADLIEIYSSFVYQGPAFVRRLASAIS